MSATVVYHDRYQDYNFGPGHPFSPDRLAMLTELLQALDSWQDPVDPPVATTEDVRTVHKASLAEQVQKASSGTPASNAKHYGLDTPDVPVFPDMDAATRGLVGGTLHAARLIADGEATRVLQLGGGLHHAQRNQASGFCVYNDLSVAIHHLREAGYRVGYLDIDVHHGDGVQWIHYGDPDVLTLSLHESGRYLFPGTGGVDELGEDGARGSALNLPLEPFTEDESYLEVFDRVVPYAFNQFQPDVLVVQCGADAHADDPLADLMLTTDAYEQLFSQILDLADTHADGRLLCTLGGGYRFDATTRIWALLYLMLTEQDLPESLPDDWRERWMSRLDESISETLLDAPRTFDIPRRSTIEQQNRRVSKRLLETVAPIWY